MSLNSTTVGPIGAPRRFLKPASPVVSALAVDLALLMVFLGAIHRLDPSLGPLALLAGGLVVGVLLIAGVRVSGHPHVARAFVVGSTTILAAIAMGLLLAGPSLAPLVVSGLTLGLTYATVAIGWRTLTVAPEAATTETRVLLLGREEESRELQAAIAAAPARRYRLVGYVDELTPVTLDGPDHFGGMAQLPAVCERWQPDVIVLSSSFADNPSAYAHCLSRGVRVVALSAVYEALSEKLPMSSLGPAWFAYSLRPEAGRFYRPVKRALDIAVALLGLAATALLLPMIAAAIRLGGGPGPILYSQARIGLGGQVFTIYKFRTMRLDAEKGGAAWAAQHDTRVTTVGRFLRQTRLDELPQFWNVLKGDMSMVGPRPERPEFVSMLAEQIPFYQCRHWVLPGITGWAQVKFPYGASVEDAAGKHQYDLYYLKYHSLWLDLKTMAMTVGVMINKVGAR